MKAKTKRAKKKNKKGTRNKLEINKRQEKMIREYKTI